MKLKWILTGLAALVVAVIVAGYAVIASMDLDELRSLAKEQAEKATGRELTLAGPIDLAISLTPAVTLEDVRFANAAWGSRPEMAQIERFEIELALLPLLSGEYQVNRLVLKGADLLVETDPQGKGNWVFETAPGDAGAQDTPAAADKGAPTLPTLASVLITDSRLTYRSGATGESLVLGIDELSLSEQGESMAVDFAGSYQDAGIALEGEVGAFGRLLAGGDYPVSLKGGIAGADLEVTGRLQDVATAPKPDLQFSLAGETLSAFDALAGSALPPLGPYKLAGRLSGEGQRYRVQGLSAKVGGSDLAGDLAVDLGGPQPALSADLTAALVDLADFEMPEAEAPAQDQAAEGQGAAPQGQAVQGGAAQGGAAQGGAARRYVIPDTPLPVAALEAANATIDAKIGTLRLKPGMEASDVTATVTLEGGKLSVSPLAAGFFDGEIEGAASLDASRSDPPARLELSIAGLDYGRLLKTLDLGEKVQGTVDVTLDLQGRGASPRAIAGSLNGRSQIVAGEGVISDKILAVVSTGLGEVLGPLFGDQDQTRLNCMVSRFNIENGVATSEVQLLDSATFSLAGGGSIDLREETLDLAFDTKTRQAALVSLAVPFMVKGTLAEPKVTPDPLGTALGAAKLVGTAVNPLAALGAMVAVDQAAAEDTNPCIAALDTTAGGQPAGAQPSGSPAEGARQQVEDAAKGAGDAVKGVAEELDKQLKGLFGD